MKNLFVILLSIIFTTTSLSQELNYLQNSNLNSERLMLSGNNNIDHKIIDYSINMQSKETAANLSFNAKQKLDSIIVMENHYGMSSYVPTRKFEYSYDEYGNTSLTTVIDRDSETNKWTPESKTEKFFNEFNKTYLKIENYWDADSNKWIPFEKYEYEYYEDGSIKMKKVIDKDYSSNNWISKWKVEYNYNVNNQLQLQVYSTWVIDSGMFIAYKTEEFTYNSFGKPDTYIQKKLNQNTLLWVDMLKNIYTYNNNNQDSTTLFLTIDYATDSLINDARRMISYNSNGFDKIALYSDWDKYQNQWKFYSKEEYNYDNSGGKTLLIRSLWSNDTGWYKINKTQFVYDNSDNLKIYDYYIPTYTNDWQLIKEYNYNYDYNYTISECYFPTYESYPEEYISHLNNKPTDYEILNGNNDGLSGEYKFMYYFSDLISDVSNQKTNEINVYPNPTNGKLFVFNNTGVKIDRIRIFNQLGQLVLTKDKISNSIDLSTLSKGPYIVELYTENKIIRKKIILK